MSHYRKWATVVWVVFCVLFLYTVIPFGGNNRRLETEFSVTNAFIQYEIAFTNQVRMNQAGVKAVDVMHNLPLSRSASLLGLSNAYLALESSLKSAEKAFPETQTMVRKVLKKESKAATQVVLGDLPRYWQVPLLEEQLELYFQLDDTQLADENRVQAEARDLKKQFRLLPKQQLCNQLLALGQLKSSTIVQTIAASEIVGNTCKKLFHV
jgi:hypothetical protein